MDNKTKELIDKLTRYRPHRSGEIEYRAHVGEMWYLTLPTKIRESIDCSARRLHKDRPWICLAEYESRYLFVATKTVHDDSDIDKYVSIVPFMYDGLMRGAVVNEYIILTKSDFRSSTPAYKGELNQNLFSLIELAYLRCANLKGVRIPKKTLDEVTEYVEKLDPNVWNRGADGYGYRESNEDALPITIPEQVLPSTNQSTFISNVDTDMTDDERIHNKYEEMIESARSMIINMIKSGKIKKVDNANWNLNVLRRSRGVYDSNLIYVNMDVLREVLARINYKGDRSYIIKMMEYKGMTKANKPDGTYVKTVNGRSAQCIAVVIRSSDSL